MRSMEDSSFDTVCLEEDATASGTVCLDKDATASDCGDLDMVY